MSATADAIVEMVRDELADVSPDERVTLFRAISEGYCTDCGKEFSRDGILFAGFCQCENDE